MSPHGGMDEAGTESEGSAEGVPDAEGEGVSFVPCLCPRFPQNNLQKTNTGNGNHQRYFTFERFLFLPYVYSPTFVTEPPENKYGHLKPLPTRISYFAILQ